MNHPSEPVRSNAAQWRARAQAALASGQAAAALADNARALELEPGEPRAHLQRAQCLLALGRLGEAIAAADAAFAAAADDPVLFDAIGGLFSQANDPARALQAFDRAVALAPNHPHFLFNRAAVRRFLGDFAAAEADYDRVIALKPDDYEAYKNRSDLRVQSPEHNHVDELAALAAQPGMGWRGGVQLRYALAKELEDLGRHAESFEWLRAGAQLRRQHLNYDVAQDVATAEWIIEAFAAPAAPAAGASLDAPVFVVGLPRSGTTLVERILGSHPQLTAVGELNELALCVVAAVRRRGGGAAVGRRELVRRSAGIDFAALGREYLARARRMAPTAQRWVDKMPLNYLYCGLIARALPNARIVHLTRHPMAACYAMYKTLFKDGYPFSYDLSELARYYAAYARLMAHWRAVLPGVIHDVAYESLVADQAGETRRLLEFLGLPWEAACIDFHRNPEPSTTASATQVRRPLYGSSVAQWRRYERELTPLACELAALGVAVP